MRPPWEWEEEDLRQLIEVAMQESINLDYKQCGSLAKEERKKNEISKDVSAFANSAGGTIVYGMIENKHVPTAIDHGFDPEDISKEWLEQVINSRIQRRIDGVKVKQVSLSKTHPGQVAYVVSIPQSLRAPHQASDKKFYKRFNFQSVAMEEYEIRDVARRSDAPDLGVEMKLSGGPQVQVRFPSDGDYSEPLELSFMALNNAPTPAVHALFGIFLDVGLTILDKGEFSDGGEVSGTPVNFHALHDIWSPSTKKLPVFQEHPLRLGSPIKFALPKGSSPKVFIIHWQACAPGMSAKSGNLLLRFDGSSVTLRAPEQSQ